MEMLIRVGILISKMLHRFLSFAMGYTRNVQGGLYFDKYSNKLGYPSPPPSQKGKQKGKKDHHGTKQVEIRAILD